MDDGRHLLFTTLNRIEREHNITFFVLACTPDLYIYHKKDSIEFNMALKGQSVAAVTAGIQKLDKKTLPGRLLVRKVLQYHYHWWKGVKSQMDRLSKEQRYFWFLIAFDGSRIMFTAESERMPLTEDSRIKLIDAVDVIWKESSRADIEYAKDTFVRRTIDTARHAAEVEFLDRKGIRRI